MVKWKRINIVGTKKMMIEDHEKFYGRKTCQNEDLKNK